MSTGQQEGKRKVSGPWHFFHSASWQTDSQYPHMHMHTQGRISITKSVVRVLYFSSMLITHSWHCMITQDINDCLSTVLHPLNKTGIHGANRLIRLPIQHKRGWRHGNERRVSYLSPTLTIIQLNAHVPAATHPHLLIQ